MGRFKILTTNDWTRVLSEEKPVLVDFQTPWCTPSLLQHDSFVKLEEEVGDRIEMFQLDASRFLPVAMTYRLVDFPALLLFKNGKLLKACIGSGRVLDMKNTIDAYLKSNGGSFFDQPSQNRSN